jgi:hypothetical protein
MAKQAEAPKPKKEPTVCIPESEHKKLIEENAYLKGYAKGKEDAIAATEETKPVANVGRVR